jgi:predicted phosphodiesterase
VLKASDEIIKQVVLSCFAIGDSKAAELFNLGHETLARYKREYKTRFGAEEFKKLETIARLQDKFSEKELSTIASGANKTIESQREFPILNYNGERVKIGYITDTHMGSKFFDERIWHLFLDRCEAENVDMILHTGDLVEGLSNRPGHYLSLTHIGYDAQKEYAMQMLDYVKNPMYIISGNHDLWFAKSNGANIVKDVCSHYENIHYLGDHQADLMVNGVKIRLFHGEDGSCFDDKTEIQTKDGWKFFSELTMEDEVATMTKENHCFEWQKPTSITDELYSGDMYHFKSRTIDCMVTPNHGMWTRVSNAATYRRKSNLKYPKKSHIRLNTNWHRKNAEDIYNEYSRQKWQFTKVCDSWVGDTPEYISIPYRESKNPGQKVHHYGDIPVDDVAELIAWYVTEGHARKSCISISQYKNVNGENYNMILSLAERIGGKYGKSDKSIRFHSAELSEWIKKECGHLSRNKFLPKWLKNCDSDILQIVFDTMIRGDGWVTAHGYGYKSISPQLLSDVAEISIKLGYTCNFNPGNDSITIYNTQVTPTVNTKPKKINYNGRIYCCEVPNGLIHIRRNGKLLWTHNSYATSYRVQKLIESFTGGDKPNILLCGHTHKAITMFDRNVHAVSGGAGSLQSDWMRNKKLPNHTGFYILDALIGDKSVKSFTSTFYPMYV